MYPAPEEHLRGEEVGHCGHDFAEGEAQPAFVGAAAPVVAVWFGSYCIVLVLVWRILVQWCTLATRGPFSPTAVPWPCDGVFVPQPHTLDPFGRHDPAGAEIAVNFGDVDAAAQTGFLGDEVGCFLRVVGFIGEICFQRETIADVRHKAVEGDIECTGVYPGHDSASLVSWLPVNQIE